MLNSVVRFAAIIVYLVSAPVLAAQTAEWTWVTHAGAVGTNGSMGISADPAGNSYITGYFLGSPNFGATNLDNQGDRDIFVAKLSPSGEWLWAASAGGGDDDEGLSVSHDSAGNAYVTGFFTGTATFGPFSVTSVPATYEDIFVAKLSPTGTWLWVKSAGAAVGDYGNAIHADSAGNIWVAGEFFGQVAFGSTTLTSAGSRDIFVAKLSPSGEWLWAKNAGSTGQDAALGLDIDTAGNSWVTGWFRGTATFGSHTLAVSGSDDVFAAKLDPAGNWLWASRAGGAEEDQAWGISVDPAGNSFVTGFFVGTAAFGAQNLTGPGMADVFVAKLDPEGNWLWANSGGGPSHDFSYGVAANPAGNAFITGYFNSPAAFGGTNLTGMEAELYVAKISDAGDWMWAKSAGGEGWDWARGAAAVSDGSCRVTGTFGLLAAFGPIQVTAVSGDDIFAAKISADGTWTDDHLSPTIGDQAWLSGVFPNPLRCGEIAFAKAFLPSDASGSLALYNLRGQRLFSRELGPGEHQLDLPLSGLTSGVYFLRLTASAGAVTKKIILLD